MTAGQVVSCVRISDVWRALGGGELRCGRGRAWWRRGDGWSVSLDDQCACWYDHRDGIGGGVLDLVSHVQGGSREDALRWLAHLTGATLDSQPRGRWSYAEAQRIRRNALDFRYAARLLAEEALEALSANNPEREVYTRLLAVLRASPEAEYRAWREHQPEWTAALVHAGRERQRRIQVALARFIVAEVSDAA